MRLTVADLDHARKPIGDKDVSKDPKFVLVSPENAAGGWLEFQGR